MSPDKLIALALLMVIVGWAPYFYFKSVRGYTGFPKERIGSLLILLGVFAWVPLLSLKIFADYSGPVVPFLIVHLSGVVPGAFLKGREWTRRLVEMFGRGGEQA